MDLVTQGCLGGVLGELAFGRKLGARAAGWGAALGLLPDVDALLGPVLDDLQEVTWHRSLTHSLLFCLAAPPLIGWALHRRYPETEARRWVALALAIVGTHVLVDCCTTWGTQVLWPFTTDPVAFCAISIVDPLFTLPLLVGLAVALFSPREGARRAWAARIGLALSVAYLAFLFGVKTHVGNVLSETLAQEGISAQRTMTKPTMGNGVLWRAVAETDDGFWIGYYSLGDRARQVEHVRTVPKVDGSLINYPPTILGVDRLSRVLRGYCTVSVVNGEVVVRDVRYGQWQGWDRAPSPYVFQYHVVPAGEGYTVRVAPRIKPGPELRRSFVARIRGRR